MSKTLADGDHAKSADDVIDALQTSKTAVPDGMSIKEQRRAILAEHFSDLLPEGTVNWIVECGHTMDFVYREPPVFTLGIDTLTEFPCHIRTPQFEELEAIHDLEARAHALYCLNFQPNCDRSAALIRSVAGSCWIGEILQGNLVAPDPVRKKRRKRTPMISTKLPRGWRGRRKSSRTRGRVARCFNGKDHMPNLFD